MAKLDVTIGNLHQISASYAELAERAAEISPRAVEQIQQIAATHGAMGYPAAVGIAMGLAREEAKVASKSADFTAYSQRFTEHAATYHEQDESGARDMSAHSADADGKTPGNRGGIQAVDNEIPLAPADSTDVAPPHGKDPRYWVDTTKIIFVPKGELPPYGSTQIGPGMYYPWQDLSQYRVLPPPAPAQFPLDMAGISSSGPGKLGPYGGFLLAEGSDGTRYWAPNPSGGYTVQPAPPPPQMPIDIRDVIQVPSGQLAPRGYIEYLPGWFAPGPTG